VKLMGDVLATLLWALAGGLVGGLVLAPLLIRSACWLVDHEPKWYRWWMGWIGGKHGGR
jgi:hypothetical protein